VRTKTLSDCVQCIAESELIVVAGEIVYEQTPFPLNNYARQNAIGLAKALLQTTVEHPLRIWVVDNSGSMMKDDGRRIIETQHKHDVKLIQCTRWAELQECVTYHSQMAALIHAPTHFRVSF